MLKVETYREHARECRELARKMRREIGRAQLIKMAETWEQIAAERERVIRLAQGRGFDS